MLDVFCFGTDVPFLACTSTMLFQLMTSGAIGEHMSLGVVDCLKLVVHPVHTLPAICHTWYDTLQVSYPHCT